MVSSLRRTLGEKAPDLADRFDAMERKVADDVLPFAHLPDFTDHGVKHAKSVEDNISRLVSEAGVASLTPSELFFTLTAALLHDIGMAAKRKPSESAADIRLDHFLRSRHIIVRHRDYLGLSKHEAYVVGEICRSHGTPTLDHLVHMNPSIAGHSVIRVSLLCALVRLGDVLDVSATRAPEAVAAWRTMYPANRIHWEIHGCISDVRIQATPVWEITVCAMPETLKQERHLFELRNWIQNELDIIAPSLRAGGLYYRKVDLALNRIVTDRSRRDLKNPFLQLASFEAKHAGRFAGRGKEIEQLIEQVLGRKLTVVIGESGVGKTSLVEAGLVPRLKHYRFAVVSFSFGEDPLTRLANAISEFSAVQFSSSRSDYRPPDLVKAITEGLKEKRNVDRVLIIGDHLEQMFTISKVRDTRDRFVRAFYGLLDSLCPEKASFLFCMRQDYLADLYDLSQQIPELYERQNTFKLYRLNRENGREVLETTSDYARMRLSPALIEQILDGLCDLGEGVVYPPYLQIVGHRLYATANRRAVAPGDAIPNSLYEELGGAERMVNDYFDGFLDQYPQAEKPIVGQILEKMVTEYYTKKRVTLQYLKRHLPSHANLEALLNSLVDRRIVRRSLQEYELIHDCLARRVVELVKKQTFLSPPVRKALRFMEANYRDTNLHSEVIARAAGVTAVHLASLFREQLGRTVNRQLHTIRIGASKRLLSEDRRPIDEIGGKVGYKSLSSFSRKFSDLEEISPLQYRKKLMAASSGRAR